ncbi:MAG: aldo/keto reductase, partial [Bacteroidales bacterium]|nr:aldo/keto reductase [Bacteroidales bacterium]
KQTLAQMAIAWSLRNPVITSSLIGASKIGQIEDIVGALKNLNFTENELQLIEKILK